MWGEIDRWNRGNPSTARAEVLGPSVRGWSVKRENGDVHHGVASSVAGLETGWWVTMSRVGRSWSIISVAPDAPAGDGIGS